MHTKELEQISEYIEINLNEKQIYIVDDDESVRRALKLLIGTYGFLVDTFISAEDFFMVVSNRMPGCLILDINLPGINGWEAHKKLRKIGSTRQVIMISADKNEDLVQMALKDGAVGFLRKPFIDSELVDLIKLAYLKGE